METLLNDVASGCEKVVYKGDARALHGLLATFRTAGKDAPPCARIRIGIFEFWIRILPILLQHIWG